MANGSIKNQGGVPFLTLKGRFVVRPKQMPDGDTLSFVAGAKYTAKSVETNVPVGAGKKPVNVRLQSIDAPEKAQPLGAAGRDGLLEHFGFDPDALGLGDDDFTAGAPGASVEGWLATHGLDGNQRPLGYVFAKNPGFKHGREISAEALLPFITQSANYMLAAKGHAFPAFYENTDEQHAALFQKAARSARKQQRGVWADDKTTTGFVPTKAALGRDGTLVYPKFFRRVEKWTRAKPDAAAFIKWLKTQADGKKTVEGAFPQPTALWKLFERVSKTKVAVPYDVSRLWFKE